MHEGLLIGTAATFGVVEHYIHAKEALLGTVGAGTTAALLGGWKKIHAEYKRINEAKQEFAQRYAADPQAFAKPPQRMFRDMFASSLPGASRTAVEQRLATVSKALKAKLLARAQKLPVTKSDLASLHDHGTLRVAMKRLLRASRPVKDAQAKRDSTRTHYRHA
jgi:glyceraldehyde-3-phosphate dehydrogenase/erythrose-4-phosphate dehydrogenase